MEKVRIIITVFFFISLSLSYNLLANNKIDKETGLIIAKGFETIKRICISCHSAKIIIQSRGNRESWLETIRWMQEEEELQEFDPETEKEILDYLSTNYGWEEEN